jgi:patatin-like phospholipase/acyl hydrolase
VSFNSSSEWLYDLTFVSTGGIIALALGRNWTIDKCIREFRRLCQQAFTPRALHGIPVLQQLRTLSHGSKYKTSQFHDALKTALGNRSIFGGLRETDTIYTPKVAVTSTNEEGRKAVVIANYNRNSTDTESRRRNRSLYEFQRPNDPSCELKYWEAAAATAAAPPYFKAFYHGPTRRSYLDGAFYNNNPARIAEQERKILWPDIADSAPDIFLSIGTSKDSRQLDREIQAAEDAMQSSEHR